MSSQFRQEFINMFRSWCADLETINPNDYEVVSSETTTDPTTDKSVKTSHLRRKNAGHNKTP